MNQKSRWTVLFALSTLALSTPLAAQNKPLTIEAQGHGEARAEADTVSVSISVDSAAPTASEAAQGNAAEVAKVTDAIKAKFGDRCTIAKANYMINPQYDSNTPAQRTGFGASEQIRVTFPTGTVTPEQAAKLTDTIVADFAKLPWPSDYVRLQGSDDDNEGHSTLLYEVRSTASTAVEAVRIDESRSAKVLQAVKATLGDRAKVERSSSVGFGDIPTAPGRTPMKSRSAGKPRLHSLSPWKCGRNKTAGHPPTPDPYMCTDGCFRSDRCRTGDSPPLQTPH